MQFTEVTGPGGVSLAASLRDGPVHSLGFDHRSALLALRSAGAWSYYRFPKASHSYDGAHGWNTEWPRIRDVGEGAGLMTMHGTLWRFPLDFDLGKTAGLRPRSTYLRVVGDFCRFEDDVVFGCDDAAKNEFLNTRRLKQRGDADGRGQRVLGTLQSQSNLWFVAPEDIERLGPLLGSGAVWVGDEVAPGQASDPYLFAGYEHRCLHVVQESDAAVEFSVEVDDGAGRWRRLQTLRAPASQLQTIVFDPKAGGEWVRLVADRACRVTAVFAYRGIDARGDAPDRRFAALARSRNGTFGLLRAGRQELGLEFARVAGKPGDEVDGEQASWVLGSDLRFEPHDEGAGRRMRAEVSVAADKPRREAGSFVYVDDDGERYRLPIGYEVDAELDGARVAREVATERDLFHIGNIFYEVPARNAGGFALVRPIATHPFLIQDYCSWRGLLVLASVAEGLAGAQPHVVKSTDGRAAVWLGVVDDLWQLGKARGHGGPWTETQVTAGERSDRFLMHGFDAKHLRCSQAALAPGGGDGGTTESTSVEIEVDITGRGAWHLHHVLEVPARGHADYEFPRGFSAYWVRLRARSAATLTAHFTYS